MKLKRLCASLVGVTLLSAASALAATCPASTYDGQTRSMTLTPDGAVVGCYAYGEGNIGNGTNDPMIAGATLGANTFNLSGSAVVTGLVEIADSGDGPSSFLSGSTTSGNSGSITVSGDLSDYGQLFLGFKFGRGEQESPDWAAFEITGTGVYQFSQSISRGELSHVVLYGTMSAVPLPASALLLMAGLGGIAAVKRRRREA